MIENMIHRTRTTLAVLALVLTGTACSIAPRVDTDYNPDYDLRQARNIAIVDSDAVSNSPAIASDDLLQNRIRRSLATALEARGYHIVPAEQAELLVSFLVTTENRTRIRDYNLGWSYARCWRCGPMLGVGADINVEQYTEGTLFIDFIDPASRQLQWRGSVTKRLLKHRSTQQRDRLIDESVTAILGSFPP